MELCVKTFSELTNEELYDLLALRTAVFVVEQCCPYQDADGLDRQALHVWLKDENGIHAYLRIMDRGVCGEEIRIGRVIAVERRKGLGSRVLAQTHGFMFPSYMFPFLFSLPFLLACPGWSSVSCIKLFVLHDVGHVSCSDQDDFLLTLVSDHLQEND